MVRIQSFILKSQLSVIMIAIFLNVSVQILLPWDIVGLFQLFVLDRHKKVISFLDPLPIPYLAKTILKNVADNFNLALEVANPASKDDITKWGCKAPKVPTNLDE
jgi:hypothetical protein